MEFSQILGFLKILGKSIKLILQNGKSMAANATLSVITSSILVLLFSFCYEFVRKSNPDDISTLQFIIYAALLVTVEVGSMYGCFAITEASWIAATLATATSYTNTDTKLSLQHLFSILKTKSRRLRMRSRFGCGGGSYSWRYWLNMFLFVAVAAAVLLAADNPNTVTITIVCVAAVPFCVSLLYTSVGWTLSAVVLVVEDGCEVAEALDKAENIVEGRRLDGVMLNLFLYLPGFITVFGFWKFVGDEGSLTVMVYGLFVINCIALMRIFESVVYTVYYFQCMEYHSIPIHVQPLGFNFHDTTQSLLPNYNILA